MSRTENKSLLIVLSAPSGGGKTTICRELLKIHDNMKMSISATTRAPRPHENNGIDYFFLTEDEFERKIRNQEFLEYEEVHGKLYGTIKSNIQQLVSEGYSVIFDVDVKGALKIKIEFPEAILFFIRPPSLEELKRRLKNRKAENSMEIENRLKRLPEEYNHAAKFDYDITNTILEETIRKITTIIEKHRKWV
jgi:guanylate kinase